MFTYCVSHGRGLGQLTEAESHILRNEVSNDIQMYNFLSKYIVYLMWCAKCGYQLMSRCIRKHVGRQMKKALQSKFQF